MDNSLEGMVNVEGCSAWTDFHIAGNGGREVESYKADMGMAHCKPFQHCEYMALAWDTSCLDLGGIAIDHTEGDDRVMRKTYCPCSMAREIHIYSL